MDDEIVCFCSHVTRARIIEALDAGAESLADIRRMTGACTLHQCEKFSPRKT